MISKSNTQIREPIKEALQFHHYKAEKGFLFMFMRKGIPKTEFMDRVATVEQNLEMII